MKIKFVLFATLFCILFQNTILFGETSNLVIEKKQRSLRPGEIIEVNGFIGKRLQVNLTGFLHPFDIETYIEKLEHKTRTEWGWVPGETPGKWLETAVLSAEQTGDVTLRQRAETIINRIMNSQESNGYLGVTDLEFRTESQPLRGMEPYELYFMMHGLLTTYQDWGNKKALQTAKNMANYFIKHIGPGKAEFWPNPIDGNAIAGHSVHYSLEGTLFTDPMLRLYQLTDDLRYFDWAKWAISNIDRWSGHNTLSKLDLVAEGKLEAH